MIPSAGFASALLFHLMNLRRALDSRPPHAIVLCGFTGQYAGGAFLGHDFHFEQAELAKLPHVTRLGAEAAGPTPPSRLHRELAEVFHPGYNGHKRTKADMLFDVAKLHFAAGDLAAFVDLTRSSAGLNPGFSQMQWLIRILETTRQGQGAAGTIATSRSSSAAPSGCAPTGSPAAIRGWAASPSRAPSSIRRPHTPREAARARGC